jgi:hypothetical protein
MLGVRWARPSDPDFDHMEVRWSPDVTPREWAAISTASDSVILAGLDVLATYWVQVRAIDRSGNVALDAANLPGTAVKANEAPEAGWSIEESEATTDIPVTDLAVHELAAEFVTTGVLDANRISTGILGVGKSGVAGRISVFDSFGRLQGTWDEAGMVMFDPDGPNKAMWLKAGFLRFSNEYTGDVDTTVWTTAITPFGINVEALTFGSVNAGSNLAPNAGAELTPFASVVDSSKVWTSAADWATGTTRINLDVSTVDLKLTTV